MPDVTDAALKRLVAALNAAIELSDGDGYARVASTSLDIAGKQLLGILDEGEAVTWAVAGRLGVATEVYDVALLAVTPRRVLLSGVTAKLFGKNPQRDIVFDRGPLTAQLSAGKVGRSGQLVLLDLRADGSSAVLGFPEVPGASDVARHTAELISSPAGDPTS